MSYSTKNTPAGVPTSGAGSQTKDPWIGHTWKIAAVSSGLGELYVKGSLQFWLESTSAAAAAVYALKPANSTELPACLAPGVLLTQCGTEEPGPLKCETPLAAPFVEPHKPYWEASHEVLTDSRDLMRLEGVIQMSDGPHCIRLYQVANVLTNNKMLLVVAFKSLPSITNSDGTAIGHN